ncbi:MAG TPA: HAD family phosphatase [Acholeplasma sp.]|nr:HAD family phosphatase [Acholeplasma sp.]
MKKIIIFDLDNTIYSSKQKKVLPQTLKLLEELSATPNVFLGVATGRPKSKIMLDDKMLDLFTYKIFINGAIVYKDDYLLYENPINKNVVKKMYDITKKMDIVAGYVGLNKEYISKNDESVDLGIKKVYSPLPVADENIYEEMPVYQFWIFTNERDKIRPILVNETKLAYYNWHTGGFDLVDSKTNKANAIKELLKDENNYQLITVGDGHNDIKMIEMADIGIAMNNSGFSKLKEKADYIAPNIEDDQLYDFFKSIKIFS